MVYSKPVTVAELGTSDHNMVLLKPSSIITLDTGNMPRMSVKSMGPKEKATFELAFSLFLVSLISGVRVATRLCRPVADPPPLSSILGHHPPVPSSPRPPTPLFSCLSRCNRAISYVVFLSFSFPSPGEHMTSLVVDPLSFVLHVLPTSTDSSPIFPSNTSVCQPLLSARLSSSGPLSHQALSLTSRVTRLCPG